MESKVAKFGGSSLADAEQFQKVGNIVRADPSRRFVVPSAPGKRHSKDTKVTDLLYACCEQAQKNEDFLPTLNEIKARYQDIIRGLELEITLEKEFDVIQENLKANAGPDYAASRGEYLNGLLLAAYLDYEFIDPAGLILFDESGAFCLEKTLEVLGARLKKTEHAVIPGFYGSLPDGSVKTFSRGGSDITGSIVARAARVSLYENWTDVSGFLIADPRIITNPESITTITYHELRELAYMGATVLHEDAIFPVRKVGIPINIRNTNDPANPGTMIVAEAPDIPARYTVTGIAGKRGFCSLNVEKDMMNAELGFGRKILQVLEDYGVSFEHLPSGIDTMSVILQQNQLEGREEEILAALEKAVHPDHAEFEHNIALVAVVGRGMRKQRGTAGRVFSALAHARVNVKMIDQGSSELNIIVGVAEEDFEKATRAVYDIFVATNL